MLPVVFEEFEMVYMFLLDFSSFHYNCQLVKGQLYKKSGELVSTGLCNGF